jgi:hypothetical protein
LASGILDRRENVLAFKIGIIFEDFFEAGSGTQEFKNIGYANTHATDTWTTTALAVVDRDAIEAFRLHFVFLCTSLQVRKVEAASES